MNRGLRVSGLMGLMLLAAAEFPLAVAQIIAGPSQTSSAPRTVRGTVVNSVTGEPISRALVQIGGQYAMLTDHEGHFEFKEWPSRDIPTWAMKPGYFSPDRFNRFVPVAVDNVAASADTEIIVKLVPEAIISGTVTWAGWKPDGGYARYSSKRLTTQDGLSRWRPRHANPHQRRGAISICRTRGGEVCSHNRLPHRGAGRLPGSLGYIPARYPPPGGGSSSSRQPWR